MQRVVALIALLLTAGNAGAFKIPIHNKITEAALKELDFSGSALHEILSAGACIDVGPAIAEDDEYCLPNNPFAEKRAWIEAQGATPNHFDDESIPAGVVQLAKLREKIVELALTGKDLQARKWLGMALHGIQDFYAHTNWVELGMRQTFADENSQLRFSLNPDAPANEIRIAEPGEKVCLAAPPTTAGAALERTLMPGILLDVAQRPKGRLLTSGYFFTLRRDAGKCTHGALIDGIHKDTPDSAYGRIRYPGEAKTYHEIAVDLATAHTKMYIRQILTPLDERSRAIFKSALIEVNSKEVNPVPTPVRQGDQWHFHVPSARKLPGQAGGLGQEIVWGYKGLFPRAGEELKAGPGGVDASSMARTRLAPPPMREEKVGALIGLVAPDCATTSPNDEACKLKYFLIGSGRDVTIDRSGKLYLLVNDAVRPNNSGSFEVELTLLRRAPQP